MTNKNKIKLSEQNNWLWCIHYLKTPIFKHSSKTTLINDKVLFSSIFLIFNKILENLKIPVISQISEIYTRKTQWFLQIFFPKFFVEKTTNKNKNKIVGTK
jgi:hypothetical protein